MFIATLIATEKLEKGELSSAQDRLNAAGCAVTGLSDVVDNRVADIFFSGSAKDARAALEGIKDTMDVAVQPLENRQKKLLISDMDSTMITVECIDELADYAGIKGQIAEITERAMQGELDFEEALRGRVALLKGLETSAIQKCLDERVTIMPGAEILVRTMRKFGAETILVSGGFTKFAKPVAEMIGFHSFHANILDEDNGQLNGGLVGEIVAAAAKKKLLESRAEAAGLALRDCLAVGDGANDIPMIETSGMGVAYHAKPKAALAADVAINSNDLTALLHMQGISSDQWVSD
jgi:phosphoserine phosphatase